MADTVDTAAPSSRADDAQKEAEEREEHATGAEEQKDDAHEPEEQKDEAHEPEGQKDEAHEPEGQEEEAKERDDGPSLTELFEQLGRELGELGMSETQLEAARNMPEVRRAARDIAGALVVAIAALTAFAFANVAAMDALAGGMPDWLAALVLAAFWTAVGVLLLTVRERARRWLLWILLKAPPTEAVEELERERNAAGKATLSTIERIGPALAVHIAMATVPDAGNVAEGVVEMSGNVLEASDEIVDVITEQLPGGGVVNQVWDVALMPGRLGVKVATTVLRRARPAEGSDGPAQGQDGAPGGA